MLTIGGKVSGSSLFKVVILQCASTVHTDLGTREQGVKFENNVGEL